MYSHTENARKLKEHLKISQINHEENIMNLSTLKEAHVYCVINNILPQKYGGLIEKFIRVKFNYIKINSKYCKGDCSKDGKNYEIKVSLGGNSHDKFNYVQIRPFHDCEYYIFSAYHLSSENVELEGELYLFKVPKEEIKLILCSFGEYSHGTSKKHGIITSESLNHEKNNKEYSLRPKINGECWKALLPFRIKENDLS